jgi:riboflavin-specific deaminase-like protein
MTISPHETHDPLNSSLWSAILAARLRGKPLTLQSQLSQSQPSQVFAPLLAARAEGRRFVIGQLGQSLDGRIATQSGHSHYINGADALTHLHRLRALVDGVIVGIGTVLADDPQLTVRRCEGPAPARIVIDPNSKLAPHHKCLAEGARRIVVGTENRPLPQGVEQLILKKGPDGIAPDALLDGLAQMGLSILLVEGGAATLSRMLLARSLDRLHVAVAPLIIGSGRPGIVLPEVTTLQEALRPTATVYPLSDGDVLFDCDLRAAPRTDPHARP